MNSIGEFCLVNLIGFVRFFMDSNCLGGSGRMSVDSLGYRGQIGVDFCWIWGSLLNSLEMAAYLDGSGKIWMALSGFDWIWAHLVGIGWIWVQIRTDF